MPSTTTRRPARRPATDARPVSLVRDEVQPFTTAVVAGAWLVLGLIAFGLEPAASPDIPIPAYVVVMAWAWLALVVATGAGLMLRRRFGLAASMGGAVVFVASSIACPVSGHHAFGLWWVGQMVCTAGLVGVSIWALMRESRPAASAFPGHAGRARGR